LKFFNLWLNNLVTNTEALPLLSSHAK
jgi:hypothetical protein